MKTIPLSRGLVTIVSDEDYEDLARHSWFALSNGRPGGPPRFVAARSVTVATNTRGVVLMHRHILGARRGQEVDHINRDPLDNRRENIRLATRADNNRNRPLPLGRHGFRGVHKKLHGAFVALVYVDGRRVRSGGHATAEDAARAYDALAIRHHGAFAIVNFPDTDRPSEAA